MIVILSDSSAYLSRAEATALGAMIAPMTYSVGEAAPFTESYIEENGAYERLVAQEISRIHTSQVTLDSFAKIFHGLCSAGHDVLCLTISSRLSGTYANARMAASEYKPSRIQIIDSLTTGGGLLMLMQEARSYIDRGMTLKQVAVFLNQRRNAVKTFFSVDDLTPLRRSGRIGNVKMSISTILNIKPVLKFENGGIIASGITRGKQEQMRTLVQGVGNFKGKVIVQNFMAETQAAALCDELRKVGNEVTVRKVGPVLAAHLGCGSVGVAWLQD